MAEINLTNNLIASVAEDNSLTLRNTEKETITLSMDEAIAVGQFLITEGYLGRDDFE